MGERLGHLFPSNVIILYSSKLGKGVKCHPIQAKVLQCSVWTWRLCIAMVKKVFKSWNCGRWYKLINTNEIDHSSHH